MTFFRSILLLCLACSLVHCQKKSLHHDDAVLRPVKRSEWPLLTDQLPPEGLVMAIDRQIAWFEQHPEYRWHIRDRHLTASAMVSGLKTFKTLFEANKHDPEQLQKALQKHFDLYQMNGSGTEVLITGYHAPIYEGNTLPEGPYRYPLYAVPKDIVYVQIDQFDPQILAKGKLARKNLIQGRLQDNNILPYFSRKEIEVGKALAGRNLELVYLKDPFEAFSFHIQGGGFLRLPSGALMKLNYAESNGRPYTSIGRILINEGKIPEDQISMQAIGAWFKQHPEDVLPICQQNESFVFYESDGVVYPEITPEMFPYGVLGFPVTSRRSIATDKKLFPGGGLAFIQGVQRGLTGSPEPFSAFVVDQDTGGAIRGNHIDWFLGAGEEAEHEAGLLLDRQGSVFFLIPKNTDEHGGT